MQLQVSGSSGMAGTGVLPKGSSTVCRRFVFGTEVPGDCGTDCVGVTGTDLPAESL